MRPGDDFLPYSRIINMKSKYNVQAFYYISSTFILFFGQRFRALSFLLLTRGVKGRLSFARQVVCHNMHGWHGVFWRASHTRPPPAVLKA